MRWVADASVAVKWLIDEELSAEADAILASNAEIVVPDLLPIEVTAALSRSCLIVRGFRDAYRSSGVDPSPTAAARLDLEQQPHASPHARESSAQHRCHVLARSESCPAAEGAVKGWDVCEAHGVGDFLDREAAGF
jgi:hypothetical protein